MGTFFVPHPSVISDMWLQCPLSWGSAASSFPPVVSWSGHSLGELRLLLHQVRGLGCTLRLSMEIQPHGCCFDDCVLHLRLLVASVASLPSKDVGPPCRRSLSSPSGDLSSHFFIDLIRSFEISPTRIVFLYSDLFSSRDSFCWSLFSHSSNLIINILPLLNKIILVPRGVFRPGSYSAIRPSRLCWGQDAFQDPHSINIRLLSFYSPLASSESEL